MEKIKITADSTCDLPAALLKEFDIAISPLHVHLGDQEQPDHPGIAEEIYTYYHQTKKTPQTSAVSEIEYQEFFRANLPQGGSIIHFNISSEFSCTHANAVAAAKVVGNVYVIDSRSLTTGTAIHMLRAIQYRNAGMPVQDIVNKINADINKVQCSFILEDLTYLHRGGRCSGTTKLLATVLRIKPQIVLRDGKMEVGKKFMGNFDMCVKKYVDYVFETHPDPDLSICFVVHTKMAHPQIVEEVKQLVAARYPFARIEEAVAGGTITAHCGENTIGIIYGLK